MKQQRGPTIRLGSMLYSFGIPDALAAQITDDDPRRLRTPIDALSLSVDEEGFTFILADDATGEPKTELKYEPNRFKDFLVDIGIGQVGQQIANLSKLDPVASQQLLSVFFKWLNYKQSKVFESEIEAGVLTFEEAREIRPEVFDVPSFQRFHAEMFKQNQMPKRRKGKRAKYRREVEELYALACRIYRESTDLSWESACYAATERRPDLVPDTWRNDPDGNLKREAARYWDKSPYTQLSYRQQRDR